jgi:hypothetical protein
MLLIRLARYTSCREVRIGSLTTVRQYASRLDRDAFDSTVDRGTRFENGTLLYLEQKFPNMHLIRTGGANDGGVDLVGWWHLNGDLSSATPTTPSDRARVVVQCKAEAKKLGPIHVRELKGVVNTNRSDNTDVLAILASSSGFSKQCLLQGLACEFPLLFLHLVAPAADVQSSDDTPPACLSMITNDALASKLLQGQMEIKHVISLDSKGRKQSTPTMFMNGKPT